MAEPAPLARLTSRLGYHFRDIALLETALTHPSLLPERPDLAGHNQRLEFLGDAVLQLIITEALFTAYPEEREGPLSQRRSALTKGGFLASLAREVDLADHLRLGGSEIQSGGQHRDAALEDAYEAVIGAMYLDSDYATVRRVVLALYGPLPARLDRTVEQENPKGRLQEKIQPRHGNQAVRYEVIHVAGEDHQREYEAVVLILDQPRGRGRGTSKKTAEEAAARAALAELEKSGDSST